MNELRWILIGFGIVLLAGIYLWGRRGQGANEESVTPGRAEPGVHGHDPVGVAHSSHAAHVIGEGPEPEFRDSSEFAVSESEPADAHLEQSGLHRIGGRSRPGRVEPTFVDPGRTEELPVAPESRPAPTLSSSDAPQPRRTERRKILSLRLSLAPQKVEGERLLAALAAESLQHGKYGIFHRLHESGESLFCIASMIEPGTFEPEHMQEESYPGITLFTQLPGPTPGMYALNEMIACARKLQLALGGAVQDDRGAPLTVHRIERMRQDVREFERPAGAHRAASASLSSTP